jgi:hypothetical protein
MMCGPQAIKARTVVRHWDVDGHHALTGIAPMPGWVVRNPVQLLMHCAVCGHKGCLQTLQHCVLLLLLLAAALHGLCGVSHRQSCVCA